MNNRIKTIDESVTRYLNEMEQLDRLDAKGEGNRADFLKEKVKKLTQKKDEYAQLLKTLQDSGQNEVSLTDQECRLMKNRGKLEPCYNAHVAIDDKNHLIVDYDVTNNASDNNLFSPVAKSAKEMLKVESIEAGADRGFFAEEDIKECVDSGIIPYVPRPKKYGAGPAKKAGVPTPDFYGDKFVYDRRADAYVCPAGCQLEFRGLVGFNGKVMRVYRTEACLSCRFFMTRCSMNKRGRFVFRWEHEDVLEEMRVRMRLAPEKMEARKAIVEHPFGTVKRAFNQGYLLLKGLRKVGGEVGFTFLAYNMRRVLNILGTQALIASLGLRGRKV